MRRTDANVRYIDNTEGSIKFLVGADAATFCNRGNSDYEADSTLIFVGDTDPVA